MEALFKTFVLSKYYYKILSFRKINKLYNQKLSNR